MSELETRMIAKQDVFVISDIHGHYDELRKLLEYHKNGLILFLGDYIDRGKQSKEVLDYVMELVGQGKAMAIKGNHEELFLDFLTHPLLGKAYMLGTGSKTIQSLLSITPDEYTDAVLVAEKIKEEYSEQIEFIRNLPVYITMEEYVFVHAGINPHLPHWNDSSEADMLWIREEFFQVPNNTGKKIIFGHTPTFKIRGNQDFSIWQSADGLIGIDGGVGFEKQLNGLYISKSEEKRVYYVEANQTIQQK